MTDKQIIDCEYLLKIGEMRTCKALNVSFYSDVICDEGHCIILKLKQQLKRKEQECEELKRQHQADKGLITSTGKMNYQLIQEYDKLKTENDNIKETFDGLFKVQYKLADNNKKLRQCLTEIKEFFNEECIICKENYINITGEICEECKYKDILQKISECEVE